MVRDAIFYKRSPFKRHTIKGKSVVPDPYQMVLSEMKLDFNKWETILSENVIYMAKRMANVVKSDLMVLPYEMLITRLYRHVLTTQPIAISSEYFLVDHVMVPLTEGRTKRIMIDGKRPYPQTSFRSSSSPSPTPNQEQIDLVDNYTLDPVVYYDQLPPIPGGASEEFKQTKGVFKFFGHFLSNLGKKK
ncbi:hypothetical protein Tco_0774299 [Tanacetum coccineum]|uniref:Uncharacterized protein n=1 Tax=Tanacetum coccineum TaxID=301880 RepID=A0ABQ4ZN47_9ASTR